MIRTSYLRIYEPLSHFPHDDGRRWVQAARAEIDDGASASRRWLVATALPVIEAGDAADGAFVRELDGDLYVCPWRTELRMLAGLLQFRSWVGEDVADAFVPRVEAERAANQLAALAESEPHIRCHILHANWHVPLRWFAAFDGTDRVLVEDRSGLRVRYETSLQETRARLERATEILEASWVDESITVAVKELQEWIDQFSDDGLLELDYSSVAGLFSEDDLVDDHSAAQVWSCLDALDAGDVVGSGRIFASLGDRWARVRACELVN